MITWTVIFKAQDGTVIATETVDCAYAHNAPKLAYKQMEDAAAVRAKCTRIEVEGNV